MVAASSKAVETLRRSTFFIVSPPLKFLEVVHVIRFALVAHRRFGSPHLNRRTGRASSKLDPAPAMGKPVGLEDEEQHDDETDGDLTQESNVVLQRQCRSMAPPRSSALKASIASGSSTMKAVPIRVPMIEPKPPMMTMARNRIERSIAKPSLETTSW